MIPARHIMPPPVSDGARIAIVSPSGTVKDEFVYGAAELLTAEGWRPYIAPHALGRYGTYAASDADRLADLTEALMEPSVEAVLCARGGYGAVHLLEDLDRLHFEASPKWLIGYSDITALHALFWHRGIASIHGPMAKHMTQLGPDDPYTRALLDTLRGRRHDISFGPHPLNRPGRAHAIVAGGNLAVMMGLFGTPFDLIQPGTILFMEDVSEPMYKVERQLYQLHLSGALRRLAGLVVGQFTEYTPDVNDADMESMISRMLADYDIPVAFGAPIGHVDHNVPVVEGAPATLTVTPEGSFLDYD